MDPTPTAAVLGLGTMGSSLATRLREMGVNIAVWNRSHHRATTLAAATDVIGTCTVGTSPAEAVSQCTNDAIIILIVADTKSTMDVIRAEGFGRALQSRTLINLASGNPSEARDIATAVAEVNTTCSFVDGAYCGPPNKARTGSGQLFLSSNTREAVDQVTPVLSQLGSVVYCGKIGASRAFDYAVVDLFFVNVLSFMSNAAALEREGVDLSVLFREMAKRLDSVPASLEMYSHRMRSRSEVDYETNPSVTLRTAASYWSSRLSYNASHGDPSHLTHFISELLDKASGGSAVDGPHCTADLSRLQEVVRYGSDDEAEQSSSKRRKL